MPERPLLIFPEPAVAERHKKQAVISNPHFPSPERQLDRLQPKLEQLEQSFQSLGVEMRDNPTGIEPEQVLVFETVGRIEDFYTGLGK